MYTFVDVNEFSEGAILPSEAFTINGKYIENQIDGYRTLNVSGREALSPDVASYTSGIRDGSTLQYKRYPERIIVVKYQLIAASNEAFRAAYNKLGQILDVKNAQLIFNDEPDKYFIGTPCIIGEVEAGRNAVVGEFEILCTDPFKYSLAVYEATAADENGIMVDYAGTYKAYPVLRTEFFNENEASEDGETVSDLTGAGDCGYVAFFNENEKIIQLGNPEEVDGTNSYAKSQTLVNSTFKSTSSWGTAAKSQWATSGNMKMGVARSAVAADTGDSTVAVIKTVDSLAKKTEDKPDVHYQIKVYAYDRTETSVKLRFSVISSLLNKNAWFMTPFVLQAGIMVGAGSDNAFNYFIIKEATKSWYGGDQYYTDYTMTYKGLKASDKQIKDISFKVKRLDSFGHAGELSEVKCNAFAIPTYTAPVTAQYYLTPENYGTGSYVWQGVSMTRNLPPDQKGESGAKNFTFSYSNIFYSDGAPASRGIFSAAACDSAGNVIAGITLQKGTQGNTATLKFHVNKEVIASQSVDVSKNSPYFQIGKSTTITKANGSVTFNVCGIKKTFKVAEISDVETTKIVFNFKAYKPYATVTKNGLQWVKFVKNNCDTWKDIPNKFSANDVLEADCNSGLIYLNGELTPSLGALGNDWEEFYLTPGLNQIGFAYSEWVSTEYKPLFSVRYREVYL